MKFKKPRGVLLGIGFGTFIVAVALFFLVPIILPDFQYNVMEAVMGGLKGLGSFNFVNVLYTALFILLVLAFAVVVIYAVMAVQKKHKIHLLVAVLSLIFVFGSYLVVSIYFLGSDINFGGKVTDSTNSLLSLMLASENALGKILSSLVLAFTGVSNVMLIVHMFVALVSMTVTEEVNAFEEKCEEEVKKAIEEKTAELVASQPASEAAPDAADEAAPVLGTILAPEVEADLEERKRKEMALFKSAIDSGYFTEYEEIEFPEPLEGVEEEPVCEASIVEEKTAFISKSSIHVGFTHD